MALAVSIRFGFVDAKGDTSFTKIRVPNGFKIASYLEFAQGAADTLSTVLDCQVTSASVCIGLDVSTASLKTVVNAVSDVAQKAQFIFNTATQGFKKIVRLPAFNEFKFLPNSDVVDQSDLDIAAFLTTMENGVAVTLGSVNPSDARENDITSLSSSRELFRKK